MYKGFLVLTSTPLGIPVGDFLSFSSEMHFGTVVFHLQSECKFTKWLDRGVLVSTKNLLYIICDYLSVNSCYYCHIALVVSPDSC